MQDERRALWIYPWDVLDSGIDEVANRAKNDWNLTALSVCTSYHSAKFILPRRSTEKMFLAEGAAVFFQPDPDAYQNTSLRPNVTRRTGILDARVIDETTADCRRNGLETRAWTVALHNSRLGSQHPEISEENVFGDRYPWGLCPSNPAVRAYAVGLVRDLATNHDFDGIDLESIGFHGLYHGHHHELIGINWGPVDEFLMGLCFCEHCLARAAADGVDGNELRDKIRHMLVERFANEADHPDRGQDEGAVQALLADWPDLETYIQVRKNTVTSLVAEIQRDAIAGSKTRLALTASTFVRGSDNVWLEGMDLAALAATGTEIILLSYFEDPAFIAADIARGRDLIGNANQMVVGLSLLAAQTRSGENLRAKVQAARDEGARKFSFYNYGFVSERRLEWLAGV